jgi:hypothetical protein
MSVKLDITVVITPDKNVSTWRDLINRSGHERYNLREAVNVLMNSQHVNVIEHVLDSLRRACNTAGRRQQACIAKQFVNQSSVDSKFSKMQNKSHPKYYS